MAKSLARRREAKTVRVPEATQWALQRLMIAPDKGNPHKATTPALCTGTPYMRSACRWKPMKGDSAALMASDGVREISGDKPSVLEGIWRRLKTLMF